MDQLTSDLGKGVLAGLAGTAAMTLMMRAVGPKVVPSDMRPTEFIPKSIVEWAEKKSGDPNALEGHEMQAGYAAHFVYGASLGALYGIGRRTLPQLPAPVMGALYGLGIWALNFEKTLPAMGIQPKVTEQPMKKRPMPLMVHLVFGTMTALAYDKLH